MKVKLKSQLNFQLRKFLDIKSEERILKLRCVEGWSMVIPWLGFSLSELLNKVQIKSTAKFVEFESVYDPEANDWSKISCFKLALH